MECSNGMVIKVKYGDMLRRIDTWIANVKLLTMDVLKRKILSLFSLTPDTELILTYEDEDYDVVNLVDDDDIRDIMRQGLDPLRITVSVSAEQSGKRSTHSSVSSSHVKAASLVQSLQHQQTAVSDLLRTLPDPACGAHVKHSGDLAFKASPAPGGGQLVDSTAEMGTSSLKQYLESRIRNDLERSRYDHAPPLGVPSDEASGLPSKNVESVEKLKPQAVNRSNEVKIPTVAGGSMVGISTFDSTAVAAALDSLNMHATIPSNDPLPNPLPLPCNIYPGRNKEVKKTIETTPLSPTADKAGKPELSGVPTKSFLQQVGNGPYVSSNSTSESAFSWRPVQNYGSQKIVHNGIICDGCDINPIRGPRFKSIVREDYDLCSTCFEKMGHEMDYIKMDFPAVHQVPSRRTTHHAQDQGLGSTLPYAFSDCMNKPVAIKLDSCFIEDVNIWDGTVMAPSTEFTKVWRMKNNGTVGWLQGTQLVWIGGAKMSNLLSVEIKIPEGVVWMDQEVAVMVDFISPDQPGRYISYWRMATPTREMFGQCVWVSIQVASTKEIQRVNARNLNLNLPPESCGLTCPEIFEGYPEPIVGSNQEPGNSKKWVDLVKPMVEQDFKFPINNKLLVGNGASSSALSSASPLDAQPNPFFTPVPPPPPPYCVGSSYFPLPSSEMRPKAPSMSSLYSAADNSKKNRVEKLLVELEYNGFKDIDLNKEIINNHPILDALKEMGFNNRVLNKALLKKHKGNIRCLLIELVNATIN